MPAKSKDLAVISGADGYVALRSDPGEALAILRENMGGETITEFDLDRVKIPTGGGGFWEVPSMDGTEAVKTIEGVVIITKNVRAYWPLGMEEGSGSDPPQCSSPDAITGEGDPGGSCELCPFSKFGTGRPGRESGQACKQMRQLFLLLPGSVLPTVLTLPPTSLAPARKYFMRLASAQQTRYWQTITKISLEQVDGPNAKYSRAVFSQGDALNAADAEAVSAYRSALEPVIAARKPTTAEAASV